MEINWAEVVTQIIGFLLVLMILKRFAWGPVLKVLDERREKIKGEFDLIETQKTEVAQLRARLEDELKNIEGQARARIQEAVREGEKLSEGIQVKAREEAHAMLARAEQQMERDRDKAHVQLRDDMVSIVIAATEKILRERLDGDAHRRQIEEFISAIDTTVPGPGRPGIES